jgi:hypothetical protein
MPLRDHFHAPLSNRRHWEGFHSQWGGVLVQLLSKHLPEPYYAEPHLHLGIQVGSDVLAEREEGSAGVEIATGNGAAVAVWAPPKPARTRAVAFPAQDVFEVCVYDQQRGSRLVAAVELVSPSNKDRPSSRRAFAVKVASYLQALVSVVVVDIVTERHDDLYAEVLGLLGVEEDSPWPGDPPLYAVACRTTKQETWQMNTWTEALRLGAPLPTMPLWLAPDLAVPLELEASYEETCRVLRIR